jgi:hypothetical protein
MMRLGQLGPAPLVAPPGGAAGLAAALALVALAGASVALSPTVAWGILAASIALPIAALVVARPFVGLWLAIVLVPLDSVTLSLGLVNLSASNVLLVASAAGSLIRAQVAERGGAGIGRLRLGPVSALVGWYAAAVVVSLWQTPSQAIEGARGLVTLGGSALALALSATVTREDQLRKVVTAILCGGALAGAVGLAQLATYALGLPTFGVVYEAIGHQDLGWARIAGTFGDPNIFGVSLVPAIVMAYSRALERGPAWQRVTCLALLAVLLGVISVTYSRTAWLAAFVALAILSALHWRLSKSGAAGLALAALLAALGALVAFGADILEFAVRLNEDSVLERAQLRAVAYGLFLTSPAFGHGPLAFSVLTARIPHNSFLSILVGSGLFALVPYLLLLGVTGLRAAAVVFSRAGSTAVRHVGLGALATLAGFCVAMVSLEIQSFKYLWLIMGLSLATWRARRRPAAEGRPADGTAMAARGAGVARW